MNTDSPSLDELMAHLEELWDCLDTPLENLPAPKWHARFGRDWQYADVPRHLAYYDYAIIAEPILLGASIPAEKQIAMDTHRQFNAWNERMMAEARRNDSIEFALDQMRASRNAIRRAVAPLDHKDLDRPVWISLTGFTGWRTVRFALGLCRQHTWVHFTQLRLRLKQAAPVPSPSITQAALNSIVYSLSTLLNQTLAQKIRLVTVLELTGPAGGAWTICVADGICKITPGEPDKNVDLRLALAPETLVEVLSEMRNPLAALLGGRIRVSGWQRVLLFLQLFTRPDPDKRLTPSS